MKRFIAVVVAALALVWFSTPADAGGRFAPGEAASTSRARTSHPGRTWSSWQPVGYTDFDIVGACAETVHATFPVDRVRVRSRADGYGNTEYEFRGALVVVLTLDSQPGRSYRFDISGPSVGRNSQIQYANGDYLTRATGTSLQPIYGTANQGTGLPRLGLYTGRYAILFTGTTKGDVITRPKRVVDLCALMGIASAP